MMNDVLKGFDVSLGNIAFGVLGVKNTKCEPLTHKGSRSDTCLEFKQLSRCSRFKILISKAIPSIIRNPWRKDEQEPT
jgi:hypothetical protein